MSNRRWYAIRTKYKCEKYVVAELERKGVHAYVPLVSKTKRYARKVKRYEMPIINCYVFVCIDLRHKLTVLETIYVQGFLSFSGEILPIPEREIDVMRQVVGEELAVETSTSEWYPGDEVEIVAAYLTGLKGRLVTRKGKNKFVVKLETIGCDLIVDVDDHLLRRLSRAQHKYSRLDLAS